MQMSKVVGIVLASAIHTLQIRPDKLYTEVLGAVSCLLTYPRIDNFLDWWWQQGCAATTNAGNNFVSTNGVTLVRARAARSTTISVAYFLNLTMQQVVTREGFDPPRLGSEDQCSNPLSYRAIYP